MPRSPRWLSRTVAGIVLATFFSDVSHEMATAVLPLYLAGIGLGPAALGIVEGVADFLVSLAKLAGGWAGQHIERKRPIASIAYLGTTLATASIALASSVRAIAALRACAWVARGFRSPLRDHMLADAVPSTHYARAFGLERAGDMLGAVVGPLLAALFVWAGIEFRAVLLWTLVPGVAAAAAMFFMARERAQPSAADGARARTERPRFPRAYWAFLAGVLLFGMGDFSRTFLILIAAGALGGDSAPAADSLSLAVVLYAVHNLIASGSALMIGRVGDRRPRLAVLVAGYALGAATNGLLAFGSGSLGWVLVAIALSGVYLSVEETLEKAAAVELLPRELRSLGLGFLAAANSIGDLVSSVAVGLLLQRGEPGLAFGAASACGAAGALWMFFLARRRRSARS